MRIFVTGATGFIGSAIVRDLIDAGHSVLGLARSDAAAASLEAMGADAHRGDLEDLDSLHSGAEASDGVIHAGFIHDFSKFVENCEIDRRAIEAIGAALSGSDRPLIVTSGTALLPQGRIANEDDQPQPGNPRIASEQATAALAARGVRAAVLRLPPSVHGEGDHGFVPLLVGLAREKGVSAYIGDGANHWPAVHRFDAAPLFRKAVELASPGAHYHGVAEQGIPFREIAEAIGRGLGVPVVGLNVEDAAAHFGWFARFAGIDNRVSGERTKAALGWQPTHQGLLADLAGTSYFTV